MKPDDFSLWAEQKGPPWDADYAMEAWTVREMPAELREAYLLAGQDRASYADVARVCGVTEDVARRRVIEAANMVANGHRALWGASGTTPEHLDARKPQPVDADIEMEVDDMMGALPAQASARHEHRMRMDAAYFEKLSRLDGMRGGGEDLRDLLSRIDEDKPPRPQVSLSLNQAKRKLLLVSRRLVKKTDAAVKRVDLTTNDCMTLLRFAFAGDARMPMKTVSLLAFVECSEDGDAARRWMTALDVMRASGSITPEQHQPLWDLFYQGATEFAGAMQKGDEGQPPTTGAPK